MKNELLTEIDGLWNQLLQEEIGVMHKLDAVKAPFFLMASQNVKSFLFAVTSDSSVDFKSRKYENVEFQNIVLSKGYKGLAVSLTNSRLYSIFLVIAADVASSLIEYSSDEASLSVYIKKVNQWKSVFNRKYEELLTPEQQLGLYGELSFMKELIETGVDASTVLLSWKGPVKDDKDYLIGTKAVEIKSSAKTDKLVKISNIHQLDSQGFEYLFLYSYSFVRSSQGSNTLVALIKELRDIFSETANPEDFEEKLILAGYFDKDAERYTNSYTKTNEDCYEVEGDFPRITPNNVMKNVLNAEYVIDLNAATSHLVTFQNFIQIIER